MSILAYFTPKTPPRPIQKHTLLEIEKLFDKYQIIVLNLPVATGKSLINLATCYWASKVKKLSSVILVPNNILLEQYQKDTTLPCLFGVDSSACNNPEFTSCGDYKRFSESANRAGNKKGKAKLPTYCKDCPFRKQESRFYLNFKFNYITNFYKYLSLKRQYKQTAARDLLIVDEAHNLVDFLKEINTHTIWQHDFDFTPYRDRDSLIAALKNLRLNQEGENPYQAHIDALECTPPKYVIKRETDVLFRNESANRLVISPITTDGIPNPLWNNSTKLLLVSATIGEEDIKELGLADRRWISISADSIIPAENRPVQAIQTAYVKGDTIKETSALIASRIEQLAALHPEEKGLIHATYAQARELKQYLKDPRYLFHTKDNKKQVFEKFSDPASTTPHILIASGMYEGVDLPYDKGRFQIISKVPYLNLGEPAVRYQASAYKDWYSWQAIKTILQACGRICRTPTDFGITYILDDNYTNLFNRTKHLWPQWFRDSVLFLDSEGETIGKG